MPHEEQVHVSLVVGIEVLVSLELNLKGIKCIDDSAGEADVDLLVLDLAVIEGEDGAVAYRVEGQITAVSAEISRLKSSQSLNRRGNLDGGA